MSRTDSLLYLDGVTVSFDGFKALNDCRWSIEPGELRSIIGPNGAGKTTMMDVITGKTRPDTGDVVFGGDTDLTRLDEAEDRRARHRAQVPEADRLREPHRSATTSLLALAGDRGVWRFTLFARLTPTSGATHRRLLATIRLADQRHRLAGAAVARPEAVARDRHAADAGAGAAAGRRAGRRDDRRRDRADGRAAARSSPGRAAIVVVEHDMAFVRALDVRGDGAARGIGACRGHRSTMSAPIRG